MTGSAASTNTQWKPVHSPTRAAPPPHLAAETPRARILVVEDQAIVALDLQRTLREAGYRVVGPATSLPAVEGLLARGRVDAAIVDADAGRLAFVMADRLADAGVPVLFLAAGTNPLPARHVGAPILEKPFSRPRLLEALEHVLAAPRLADEELPYAISPPPVSWPRVFPQL
ncbi:response regulator [Reyranella sp.]|uniref:response regulator n=1 Tax=Reyranella sp. TaxID=1929291 RepID=UPI003BAD3D6B